MKSSGSRRARKARQTYQVIGCISAQERAIGGARGSQPTKSQALSSLSTQSPHNPCPSLGTILVHAKQSSSNRVTSRGSLGTDQTVTVWHDSTFRCRSPKVERCVQGGWGVRYRVSQKKQHRTRGGKRLFPREGAKKRATSARALHPAGHPVPTPLPF